jgi:Cyclopropane fatty acid synthase and related methyltransferases
MKPTAESCLQNRAPILAVLREVLAERRRLLEIGSGTGQHAVYFAPELPHLTWQTSDLIENHPAILAWLADAGAANILPPLPLDVRHGPWPEATVDAVFSANTAHIMGWPAVEAMFAGVGRILEPGGVFALYGPFNYGGQYTAASNSRFDAWLRQRDPASGVRDFEALDELARKAGLGLWRDYAMPADNRTLIWLKPLR